MDFNVECEVVQNVVNMKFYCIFKILTKTETLARSTPFGPHETEQIALIEGEKEARQIAEGFAKVLDQEDGHEMAVTKFIRNDAVIFNSDGKIH